MANNSAFSKEKIKSVSTNQRDFLEQFANRSINVRDTLLRLNSLKYSIRIMESLAKEKNAEWNNKLKLIESLRKNWFKEKDFDLLVSLNENAIHMAMEITGKFRNFLSKNNLVKILSGNNVRYSGIKNKSVFVKNWSKDKALQEMSETAKNGHRFCSILPIELAPQLAEYSRYDGPVSSHVRKNVNGNLDYQLKYKKILENRIGILNSQAELALKLGHSDFAAFFDFGYRNTAGINNWILSLSDKFRF